MEPCQAHRHLQPSVVTYSAYLPHIGPTVCLHSHTWPHLPAEAKSIIPGPMPSLWSQRECSRLDEEIQIQDSSASTSLPQPFLQKVKVKRHFGWKKKKTHRRLIQLCKDHMKFHLEILGKAKWKILLAQPHPLHSACYKFKCYGRRLVMNNNRHTYHSGNPRVLRSSVPATGGKCQFKKNAYCNKTTGLCAPCSRK